MKLRVIGCLVMLSLAAFAQDDSALQSKLEAAWKGKVLQLRDFDLKSDQKFNEHGVKISRPEPCSWTQAKIDINEVKLKKDLIEISGDRIGLLYDDNADTLKNVRLPSKIAMKVQRPAVLDDNGIAALTTAMFAPTAKDIDPLLPNEWHAWARGEVQIVTEDGKKTYELKEFARDASSSGIHHIGKDVTAPKPIHDPDPEYTEFARRLGIQGISTLEMVVEADGRTSNIAILKPLGVGLDEKAADIVRIWTFHPATKDGKPVRTAVIVEVGFHLYR